jgi:hypothetical protein
MTPCAWRKSVLLAATTLSLLIAVRCAAGLDAPIKRAAPPLAFDLFRTPDIPRDPILPFDQLGDRPRHWVRVEVQAARAYAQDWLRSTGFSLLEDRDSEGRHRYQVFSRRLTQDWPEVRVHTRIGRPVLSAGLQPRRNVPAFGLTIPGPGYVIEAEGFQDRELGWSLMGRVYGSSDPGARIRYGVAVPFTLRRPSVGVLFQLQVRLGD